MSAAGGAFRRDRATGLAYLGVAGYAFLLYAMGPVTAYLRRELHLSYTVASLHSTLWAAGTVVTGLAYGRLTARAGRRRVLWCAALGMALGAALLVGLRAVAGTLLAAAVLGTAGTMLQTATMAILATRHPAARDRALVEANLSASGAAVLAPAVLGALQPVPGWRWGYLLPVGLLAGLYALFRRERLGSDADAGGERAGGPVAGADAGAGRLPAAYWPAGVLVGLVVGVEFCVIYFAPQLLHGVDHVSTDAAATALVAFYLGELAGRGLGSRLTRRPGRARPLTYRALALTAAALPLVWLTGRPVPAIAGLFLLGLGVANLYPLTLALAVAASGGQPDLALARAQLLVGAAVAVAPLALGTLADAVGVGRAFALEPALVVAAAVTLAVTGASVRNPDRLPSPALR